MLAFQLVLWKYTHAGASVEDSVFMRHQTIIMQLL